MKDEKLLFLFERETMRKYRLVEVDEDRKAVPQSEAHVGTLYVSKELFDERPEQLEVTLHLPE